MGDTVPFRKTTFAVRGGVLMPKDARASSLSISVFGGAGLARNSNKGEVRHINFPIQRSKTLYAEPTPTWRSTPHGDEVLSPGTSAIGDVVTEETDKIA